jgi:hypothetical protein
MKQVYKNLSLFKQSLSIFKIKEVYDNLQAKFV